MVKVDASVRRELKVSGGGESETSRWRRWIAVLVAAMMMFSGSQAVAALASEDRSGPASSSSVADVDQKYSDADVLALLFAGQGPAATDNPELLRYLGFAQGRPMTDPDVLDELVTDFLDYYPEFSTEVRGPLESGDPRQVESALMELTREYEKYYLDTYDVQLNAGNASLAGCGVAWACAAVTAFAVANGAVYATVAGATFVLVAAAAVFVVGPVAYLDDKNGIEGRATALEKDEITLRIAEALAG